ncbi:hypothetical protein JX265_013506 [Neoarthrinium moseri]|uniref:Leucine-rich repeat domain-containing protein n=1 Tax=Neoarthrinium moseri TaxID=1658444 RepID=A0A9Q0AHM5_9PEZI|nr:hypothetical protein JX266_012293 [Neoarthrinium moseri]KAI1849919.1 hypothetical protein JX265_013506 [Neoarthrinium moseri]
MMPSDSLACLPPELLARVCEFIELKRDLSAIIRSTRQLYGVATAYLYRDIDLLSAQDFDHRSQKDENNVYIESLARAFLRDPQLGHYVRRLAIRLPETSSRHQLLTPLDLETEVAVRSLLSTASGPATHSTAAQDHSPGASDHDSGSEEWDTTDDESDLELEADSSVSEKCPDFQSEADMWVYFAGKNKATRRDVFLTLLLSRVPRLECLDLEKPKRGWRTGFLDQVLNNSHDGLQPFKDSPMLSSVRKMCFGYTSPEIRGESWIGSFLLPGLEELYLHRIYSLGSFLSKPAGSSSFTGCLNITHLELRDCRIPPPSLRRLLAGPKALRTFIYVIGEPSSQLEFMVPISYKSVRAALEQQKNSLEHIWIDYPHDYSWDEMTSQHTHPMGSFSGFTKLKHLHIAGTYLFGFVWESDLDPRRLVQALPQQIETVHISHADEDDETFEGVNWVIAAKKEGRLQDLTELKLEADFQWLLHARSQLRQLAVKAEAVSLHIKFFDNSAVTRIEEVAHWKQVALRRQLSLFGKRFENPWGFKGEVSWPERVSGCMQTPIYWEVAIDDSPYPTRISPPTATPERYPRIVLPGK